MINYTIHKSSQHFDLWYGTTIRQKDFLRKDTDFNKYVLKKVFHVHKKVLNLLLQLE